MTRSISHLIFKFNPFQKYGAADLVRSKVVRLSVLQFFFIGVLLYNVVSLAQMPIDLEELAAQVQEEYAKLGYDKRGQTPLMNAVETGNVDEVRHLLLQGAEIDKKSLNSDWFMGHGSEGETALMIAVEEGYYNIVKLLVESGANLYILDPSERSALHMSIEHDDPEIAEYLFRAADPKHSEVSVFRQALVYVVLFRVNKEKWRKFAKYLLDERSDSEAKAMIINRVVKLHSPIELLDWFLGYGIDPDARVSDVNNAKLTPLMRVAFDNHFNWNSQRQHDHLRIAKLLLDYGADVNAQDARGKTVLMWALPTARFSSAPPSVMVDKATIFLRYLLSRGADPNVTDSQDRTIKDIIAGTNYCDTTIGDVVGC